MIKEQLRDIKVDCPKMPMYFSLAHCKECIYHKGMTLKGKVKCSCPWKEF